MRKPVIAGNWKMNKTVAEATELVMGMRDALDAVPTVTTVLCPPFLALPGVAGLVSGTRIGVGAQNLHWEEIGAFTGEVSPAMLSEFCQYVIIGHSERREHFGETDESVNRKVRAALAHGLIPIVCVGETLDLRQAGRTGLWVENQVTRALEGLTATQVSGMVMAYEPIWAIGTGLAASADEAERVCGEVIRSTVAALHGDQAGENIRIQYGGSVKPGNASELMSQPNIDGALVGGASLQATDFCQIVVSASIAKGLADE